MNCTFGGVAQDGLQTDTTLGHGYDLRGNFELWNRSKSVKGWGEKTKCREMFDRKLLSGMSIGVTGTKITVEGDGGLLQGAGELVSRHLLPLSSNFFLIPSYRPKNCWTDIGWKRSSRRIT